MTIDELETFAALAGLNTIRGTWRTTGERACIIGARHAVVFGNKRTKAYRISHYLDATTKSTYISMAQLLKEISNEVR